MRTDALIIGAGPAGASAAISLARAGWNVMLVEQHSYPRQKVCGECVAAGNFSLLDELGVGSDVRRLAGAALRHTGWMDGKATVIADMPPCGNGPDQYGRALGRDILDSLLINRARGAGARVLQPARVRGVQGSPGEFRCEIVEHIASADKSHHTSITTALSASIVIDAHGSWEAPPLGLVPESIHGRALMPHKASDLFAFKASFSKSSLAPGFLPVVALPGGYGGLVCANGGRTTVALCLRRDGLRSIRMRSPKVAAGAAVERFLRDVSPGVAKALAQSERQGSWLSVGPLRPGTRLRETPGIYRIGNAAGESHPLIGEGISMALQSSRILVDTLLSHPDSLNAQGQSQVHADYSRAWRKAFMPRLHLSALYAHIAMRPVLSAPVGRLLVRGPRLLTVAARWAAKARQAVKSPSFKEEPI